jgi:hypothetical protein
MVPVKDQYSGLDMDSKRVQKIVDEYLLTEGFASQGRFGSGYCDYYTIGGRWSGQLSKERLDMGERKEFEKLMEIKYKWAYDNNKKEAIEIFHKIFPEYAGKCPYFRDRFHDGIFEDDAQIVDEQLYDAVIDKEINNIDSGNFEAGGEIITTNYSATKKKI